MDFRKRRKPSGRGILFDPCGPRSRGAAGAAANRRDESEDEVAGELLPDAGEPDGDERAAGLVHRRGSVGAVARRGLLHRLALPPIAAVAITLLVRAFISFVTHYLNT